MLIVRLLVTWQLVRTLHNNKPRHTGTNPATLHSSPLWFTRQREPGKAGVSCSPVPVIVL